MKLWSDFAAKPFTHDLIPYVGSAGYRLGAPIPDAGDGVNVRDFGACGDGRHDDAGAINRAIAQVGAEGGGVVRIPPGRYAVGDIIRVGDSNVVLRGAGSTKTVLAWTAPLEDLIGPSRSRYGSDSSAWGWSGGLLWVCPTKRLVRLLDGIRQRRWPWEGWDDRTNAGPTPVARVTRSARRGDREIAVDTCDNLFPGQRVLLRWNDCSDFSLLQHICGDVPAASAYNWDDRTKLLSYLPFTWPVMVRACRDGRTVLSQPLPLDIRDEWNVSLAIPQDVVTDVGVEGLTLELPPVRMSVHLQDRGFNGLAFQCAWDCWSRDLIVTGGENGILLTSSKSVTISQTRVQGVSRHHSYVCREQSHDNLFTDFEIRREAGEESSNFHHGINVEGLSSGNVWTRGRMEAGTFDSHRGLPFGNVRTHIDIFNDGFMSGSPDAGPRYGARFVHWNVRVLNGRADGILIEGTAPCSATVGVSGLTGSETVSRAIFDDLEGDLDSVFVTDRELVEQIPDLYQAQRQLAIERDVI
ncbi:glycosyl hydrolase family 28-related protein [Planomonospora sphaerica]|uniref:glycosyl hydrolase family 28-related protein n=1 Tax=Planomonospora sphaerica TaxID=161355 RepID=UPI000AB2F9E0|nr:glycosyl hydrolase family 28-related protein [Planomonospora sphaerica]